MIKAFALEYAGELVNLALFVWIVVLLRRIEREIVRVGSTRPIQATPSQIKYWRRRMDEYEPGTPKHAAYRHRLVQAGELEE